ncbi:MAG: type II toxin-antitoxin system VapC family toxin [Theionarchaea archaeon]|nr:type II toxin-antitoxin system VapC family toxin [Theionarchaea archaeon]
MPDNVVVDSSVIASIFFREEASERAERVAENYELTTVDVAVAETANVAWKRVVFFNEPREITLKALKRCTNFIMNVCNVITSQKLLENGFEIAIIDGITLYDALFVAASKREKIPLLTLDKTLYEKLHEKRNIKLI